jgi:CheY-like chemotaxis protein
VSPSALVVDDDTVSRLLLGHLLRRAGWDVEEVDDVAPALAAAAATHFDVIFSDYSMPGGTGEELAHALAAGPSRPAFVLVTGVAERVAVAIGSEGSIDAHMPKPVGSRALARILEDLAERLGRW